MNTSASPSPVEESQPTANQSAMDTAIPQRVADIASLFSPSDEAARLLTLDMPVGTALELLVAKELYRDAVRLVACTLPFQQAVWWGFLCVWDGVRSDEGTVSLAPAARKALEAALAWIQKPEEAERRAAFKASEIAGIGTEAGSVALAAGFSNQLQTGRPQMAVAAAVLGSAVQQGPENPKDRLCRYISLAIEVARQELPWA